METTNAARGKVEIELKGKKYTLLELDLDEYGEMENFIKSKYARLYRQSADDVEPEEREAMVIKILKTPYTPEELAQEMNAVDCVSYAAYLMLRHNSGVTRESVKALVDQSTISVIRTAIDSFGEDEESPPEATQEKS